MQRHRAIERRKGVVANLHTRARLSRGVEFDDQFTDALFEFDDSCFSHVRRRDDYQRTEPRSCTA